ncbi:TIGR02444 family protein [Alkalimarinus coralli]|uniref:TIGR02444 family protein n=1 Tax=Alkalimarinus coralli TaxID=2935863 RepID=UPI00202B40A6|nr:TIGR02444 family protein [Alkalimarinus coralli]
MPDQTNSSALSGSTFSLPQELPLNTPFWDFSISLWKSADAQRTLLHLQDEYGLKVNRLLFCCWLGFERKELLAEALAADSLLAEWSEQTVTPLRNIRKQLKHSAPHHPQLRATVQSAELQAEQIEQALLFKQTDKLSRPTTKRNTLQTLSFNLLSYTEQALQDNERISRLVTPCLVSLVQATIPNHERSHIEIYFPGGE